VKDPQASSGTGDMLGTQRALAKVIDSQAFQDLGADFLSCMSATVGTKKKRPRSVSRPADVFIMIVAAKYLFLTRFLMGKVNLPIQVTQSSQFLTAVAKIRMTAVTVMEAQKVADAMARILLPRQRFCGVA